MKKIGIWIILAILLLNIGGCSTKLSAVETGIRFDSEKVLLLSEKYVAVAESEATEIYTIDRFKDKTTLLAQIDGKYTLTDAAGNKVLLENANRLLCYNLNSKETTDIYDNIFTEEEQQVRTRYRSFFIDGGKRLVVTKILYDPSKPIMFGKAQGGQEVSADSGIYIYDFTGSEPKLERAITLETLGLDCTGAKDLTFVAWALENGDIALYAQIQPILAAFADKYFITIDANEGTANNFGKYSLGENQDAVIRIAYFKNRMVVANSKQVFFVDFITQNTAKSEYAQSGVKTIDIWHGASSDSYFVHIQSSNGYLYNKYSITGGSVSVESALRDAEPTEIMERNGRVRGNFPLKLSSKEAEKYPELGEARTVYRSLSDAGYLYEHGGNTVVLFK